MSWNRRIAAAAGSLLVLVALGAADEMKSHEAGEIRFEAPATWKTKPTKSAMRKAELEAPAAAGDKAPGELVVFVFPKGAGTVEANIDRWARMFKNADGDAPSAEVKQTKGKNVEVTRVEVAGRYVAPIFPGSPETYDEPNYRLFGAIVQTDSAGYFFKMVGPDKTMNAARAGFDAMLASMTKKD
ncbi:MAG: hypothetical protein SFX72_21310 [Isosphaeraceae bacterium]|nr:hypothetical protein [Isosphaeraceae bacterium]